MTEERFDHLRWPFFGDTDRTAAAGIEGWARRELPRIASDNQGDVESMVRSIAASLGAGGLLPAAQAELPSCRHLCLVREVLAYHNPLADFAFAMQSLGSAPLMLAGDNRVRERFLPSAGRGEAVTAFAISEADAGSDVAAITTTARRDGDDWILNGEKTWISNGGLAGWYVVLARTGEAPGSRGLTLFVVEAAAEGFDCVERIETMSPHPLGRLRFENCLIPDVQRIGEPGQGFKISMRVLDLFRPSVAAAALGFARRAFDEVLAHVKARTLFGTTLGELQMTQAAIAAMATDIDAAALLTYRAAWSNDTSGERNSLPSAMAKWNATESAQRVIDRALQLFGARGLVTGHIVERLYRDVRALRIYEGSSEIQQLVIARSVLGRA